MGTIGVFRGKSLQYPHVISNPQVAEMQWLQTIVPQMKICHKDNLISFESHNKSFVTVNY
jgi:hypothetical protein